MMNPGANGGIEHGGKRRDTRRDPTRTERSGGRTEMESVGTVTGHGPHLRLILAIGSIVIAVIGLGLLLRAGK